MADSKHPAVVELPILQYKNEILKNIRNFPITLISGDTGCGKVSSLLFIKQHPVNYNYY